jgi:hypothetical protein
VTIHGAATLKSVAWYAPREDPPVSLNVELRGHDLTIPPQKNRRTAHSWSGLESRESGVRSRRNIREPALGRPTRLGAHVALSFRKV